MANLAQNPIIPNDGTLVVTDGAGPPLSYEFKYEGADTSISNVKKGQKATQNFYDRNRWYAVRETQDEDIEISFSCDCVAFAGDGSTTTTPYDVFLKQGTWASATNLLPAAVGGGSSGVWCVKLTFTAERTDLGATTDAVVVAKYFHCESIDFSEGTPSTLSFKGKLFPYSTDYLTLT